MFEFVLLYTSILLKNCFHWVGAHNHVLTWVLEGLNPGLGIKQTSSEFV